MANKAYKFRMYPNKEQKNFFAKTFGCVRFIYNQMLSDKIAYYNEHKKMLNNTPAQYKAEYSWLKETDSLALANAQRNLNRAFTNFFTNPACGFPKYKSRKSHRCSYTTNNQNGTIQLKDGKIKLPKVGWVNIKQHRLVPEDYQLKSAAITKSPSGKYYVSVLFACENQAVETKQERSLGLDFSMRELYRDSNGNEPKYPGYYRKAEKKLKREQRKLSKMQKDSKNREKQRIKVARLYEKTANQRKDFLHKQSRKLTQNYDIICIENLNMKAMAKTLHLGKSVADNGWGMFTGFLQYKLEEEGKRLVKVDTFYASSQLCHVCGYKNTETKDLSVREWDCPVCKTHHNRDVNAARNIHNEGLRLLSA